MSLLVKNLISSLVLLSWQHCSYTSDMLALNKKAPPSSIHYRTWVLAKFPTPRCYATSCFAVTRCDTPLSILQPLSYNDVSEGETCNYSRALASWQHINGVSSLVFVLTYFLYCYLNSLPFIVYEYILHVMAWLVSWKFWVSLSSSGIYSPQSPDKEWIDDLLSRLCGTADQFAVGPLISLFLKHF